MTQLKVCSFINLPRRVKGSSERKKWGLNAILLAMPNKVYLLVFNFSIYLQRETNSPNPISTWLII